MKQKLLLKVMLLLFALIAGSSSSWADDATITFANQTSGTSDSGNAYTTSNFVSNGITSSSSAFGTITCSATSRCYSGKTDHGMKVGASSNAGSFTIAFSTPLANVSKITLNRASYNTSNATTITVKNGSTTLGSATTPSGSTAFADMEITNLSISSLGGLTIETAKYCYIKSITITYTAAGTTAAPTISGNTPFFGTTEVTITNAASADGADRFYTLNEDAPTTTASATCFAYSAPFTLDATATVKAIAKKSTDTNASTVVSKAFTKVTPTTVAAALTAINSLADNGTIAEQSVRGIVTEVGSYSSNTITYTISDDVAGSNSLKVYKGKGLHNANFAAATDVKVGDDVVIYGTLKKYKSGSTITPEFLDDNYLLYQEHKTAPTFTLDRSNATLSMGNTETVDVNLTTNTDGAITCESTNTNVATVALKSAGVYTITAVAAGSATIKIKSALTDNYQPAQANVSVTVNDNREAAGLAFTNASVTKTWGEEFTGQALTNPHSLPVTWSSTVETVATVDNTGAVTVLKAGSTTIKATFDGDATYKKSIVSYTLTINKAPAGLSYTTTEFDIMLNDDSFVAPTLNNPNSLTVTYASNNPAVAVVDENTGELVYDETAAGTAMITATFAGNDNYYAGSANYTINIIDPTVKGTKYNPYTVAEVIGQSTATSFGNNKYVTGYIVGCVNGSTNKCYKTTTASLVDTNFLLSDTQNTSFTEGAAVSTAAGSGMIPIELPNGTIRTNWGVASNNVFGYKVLVKGNAQAYFSAKGIKGTSEINAVSIPLTPAKTYTTLTSKYDLDFTGLGLEAYIVKDNDLSDNAVTMTQVNKVPANTGLVLVKTSGTTFNVPVFDGTGADDVTGNKMAGSATEATAIVANGGYILSEGAFHPASAGNLPAGKAYLAISASAPILNLDFGGETTGINAVNGSEFKVNGEYYNLAGQRVAQPTKGLYIVNGKKVIIK